MNKKEEQHDLEKLLKENSTLRKEIQKLQEEITNIKKENTTAFIVGDAIADGICVTDGKGVVTSINRGYTEITGIEESEMIGRSVEDLVAEGYFSNAVSMDVIRRKEKISAMSVVGKNNNKVLLVGTPFLDENGEVVSVITVMRNLTELFKLREELEDAEKKKEQYKAQLRSLKKGQSDKGFIGSSEAILHVKTLIEHVGHSDATVLITGETGSGKEVVAREIYKLSSRKNGPYVKVNCAAIPESLIESELFGYEKGAFTGAGPKEKKGYFEIANGGTILLDEISEMPINLQPKILRVLQEKEITRVGGTRSINLDIRIIASTNRVLKDMIANNEFRSDLYYRLNVFPIQLPPLRDRRDDISALAQIFLDRFNIMYEKSKTFTDDAINELYIYDWPGNVRELENAVERMVIMLPAKRITGEDVRILITQGGSQKQKNNEEIPVVQSDSKNLKDLIASYEKKIIKNAIEKYGNSYSAAKALGTSQPTVVRKAHAYNIPLLNNHSKNQETED